MAIFSSVSIRILTIFAAIVAASTVIELNPYTFDNVVTAHAAVMIEFYAPWCQVCQDVRSVYEEAALISNLSKDIVYAQVDCAAHPALCDKYGTPIFPTFRLFQGLQQQVIYNGARTPLEISTFAERKSSPTVTILTENEIEEFRNGAEVAVVGYWDKDDDISNQTFTTVAVELSEYFAFGATNDAGAARSAGVKQPGVALYKQYDGGYASLNSPLEPNALNDFVILESMPLIGEYNQRWSWRYLGKGTLPFLGIFTRDSLERQDLSEKITPIAQEFSDYLRVATVDPESHDRLLTIFDLEKHDSPVLAIRDLNAHTFRYPENSPMTTTSIRQWVKDFQERKLEEVEKGERSPKASAGSIKSFEKKDISENNMTPSRDEL